MDVIGALEVMLGRGHLRDVGAPHFVRHEVNIDRLCRRGRMVSRGVVVAAAAAVAEVRPLIAPITRMRLLITQLSSRQIGAIALLEFRNG